MRSLPEDRRRRSPAWVPLATAAVAAALLGTTVDGSQATTVTGPPPAADPGASLVDDAGTGGTAAAGTLLLVLREQGAGFTQGVTDLAPGDSASRYVEVVETGTLDGRDLTMTVDGTGPLAPALAVTVDGCRGGSWTPATGTCDGTVRRLLPATPLAQLAAARVLDARGPARRLPLRITLSLSDRDEQAVNGVLPAGSLQGARAQLRWSFRVVQA